MQNRFSVANERRYPKGRSQLAEPERFGLVVRRRRSATSAWVFLFKKNAGLY